MSWTPASLVKAFHESERLDDLLLWADWTSGDVDPERVWLEIKAVPLPYEIPVVVRGIANTGGGAMIIGIGSRRDPRTRAVGCHDVAEVEQAVRSLRWGPGSASDVPDLEVLQSTALGVRVALVLVHAATRPYLSQDDAGTEVRWERTEGLDGEIRKRPGTGEWVRRAAPADLMSAAMLLEEKSPAESEWARWRSAQPGLPFEAISFRGRSAGPPTVWTSRDNPPERCVIVADEPWHDLLAFQLVGWRKPGEWVVRNLAEYSKDRRKLRCLGASRVVVTRADGHVSAAFDALRGHAACVLTDEPRQADANTPIPSYDLDPATMEAVATAILKDRHVPEDVPKSIDGWHPLLATTIPKRWDQVDTLLDKLRQRWDAAQALFRLAKRAHLGQPALPDDARILEGSPFRAWVRCSDEAGPALSDPRMRLDLVAAEIRHHLRQRAA